MNEPEFDWNDANEGHFDEHRVTVEEAEEALLDPRRLPAAARSTATERRYATIGATAAGRILFVAFTIRRRRIRVITAYTAPDWMRRQYRRRRLRMGTEMERRKTIIHRVDEIPTDMTEAEEHRFWSTHTLSEELVAQAEPLPADVVALLDRIREKRARRTAAIH